MSFDFKAETNLIFNKGLAIVSKFLPALMASCQVRVLYDVQLLSSATFIQLLLPLDAGGHIHLYAIISVKFPLVLTISSVNPKGLLIILVGLDSMERSEYRVCRRSIGG